jgi:hypothetical protein
VQGFARIRNATVPSTLEAPMKRKLRLDLDTLQVESFAATQEGDGRGTVQGHGYTEPPYPSCARTCGATPPPPSEDFCRMSGTCPMQCCL